MLECEASVFKFCQEEFSSIMFQYITFHFHLFLLKYEIQMVFKKANTLKLIQAKKM